VSRFRLKDFGVILNIFEHQPSLSKFIPPSPSPGNPARPRLLERLSRAAQQKYVLVQAPQGYTKTVLLSDWYHSLELGDLTQRAVWFKVDENDRDPSRFWGNMVSDLESCWPGVNETLQRSSRVFEQASIRELTITIANHIVQSLDMTRHYYLFMLNFEAFKFSESESQFLIFTNMLPSNIHVIISSRVFMNNQLLEQGDYNELNIIGVKDLSFNKQELQAYLDQQLNQRVAPELIELFHRRTEGWPLAASILVQEAHTGRDLPLAIREFSGNNRYLANYVFEKTVSNLPQQVMSFLMETSFLDCFCASLCNAVTGNQDSPDIIRYLERNGVFTTAQDMDYVWFCYHPLFCEWLKGKSMTLRSDQLRGLFHRAGQWYRAEGMRMDSTRFVIAATDGIFVQHLTNLVFGDLPTEYSTFLFWLFSLPKNEAEDEPRYCLLAAWAFAFSGRPQDASYWCRQARKAMDLPLAEDSLARKLDLILRIIEAKCQTLLGEGSKGITLSNALLEGREVRGLDDLKLVLYQNLAEAYEQEGDFAEAMKFFTKTMTGARINNFEFLTGLTRFQIITLLYRQGQFKRAEELCRTALAECPPDYTVYGALYALLSLVFIEQNLLSELDTYFNRVFHRVSTDRNIDIYIDACTAYSRYLGAHHNAYDAQLQLAIAIDAIRKCADVPPRGVAYKPFFMQAGFYLKSGDVYSAEEILNDYQSLGFPESVAGRLCMESMRLRIAAARDEGIKEVIARNEELIAQALDMDYRLLAVELLLFQTQLHYQLEQSEPALKCLRKALETARRSNIIRVFLDAGETIRVLLMELSAARKGSYEADRFIRTIIKAFEDDLKPGTTRQHSSKNISEYTGNSGDNQLERLTDTWNLTRREREILLLLYNGMNRKDIASELFTSQNTVKTHIAHIYEKIGVHSVTELHRILMGRDII
jgi:LuxR family maltose regulon positive regulatory protein